MRIVLVTDTMLRVEPDGVALVVEAPDASRGYQPLDMLASALGTCTHATLAGWGEREGLAAAALRLAIAWTVADHRAASYAITIEWDGLAPARARVAERVAATCPVHRLLGEAVPITVAVGAIDGTAAA
jgi:uncharacterized OsmC-like protein